jgi:hypothetical protein
MKPIEECLDRLLLDLKHSYETDGRPPLNYPELEKYFDAPLKRHEFFKELIDILVENNHAKFLPGEPYRNDLEFYIHFTMITTKGLYFINYEKGYVQQKINRNAENTRLRNIEKNQRAQGNYMIALTVILAASAVVAIPYYLLEIGKSLGQLFCRLFCG